MPVNFEVRRRAEPARAARRRARQGIARHRQLLPVVQEPARAHPLPGIQALQ
jgi:hypothetical protein